MRRLFVLLFLTVVALAKADEQWLGVYLDGKKVGYSMAASEDTPDGRLTRSVSVISGRMLGQSIQMRMDSETRYDPAGRIAWMKAVTTSSGRTVTVVATFTPTTIEAALTQQGSMQSTTLTIPQGARIVDDPLGAIDLGATTDLYVFDPGSVSLVKVDVRLMPEEKVTVDGKETTARVLRIEDPRAPMTAYLSQKGDLIKAVGPFGMEMRPEPAEVAQDLGDGADIAFASAIQIEGWPGSAGGEATFDFSGIDLSHVPSDGHQTVVKTATGWRVTVHPGQARSTSAPSPGPEWSAPDLRLQSDDPAVKKVVEEVAGDGKPAERAERLRLHVLQTLRANAGIGVLRDATEVLSSREGVCRDHAILLATLVRAAGIPARLVSGVVEMGGAFYYHAWIEAYLDGTWVALDSTRAPATVDATHVKVAHGSVGDAFTSFLLDGARVRWVQGD